MELCRNMFELNEEVLMNKYFVVHKLFWLIQFGFANLTKSMLKVSNL